MVLNVYKSYMDETGIQRRDRFCTIAGYVATADEWDELERRWRFVLDAYHVKYFHALEFYGGTEPYKGWKRSKRDSFINAVFDCVAECDLRPVASAIDCDIFWSLTEDERHYITGGFHNGVRWKRPGAPSKPYFIPFHGCIIQAARLVPDGGMLYPVMSRQEQYKMKALELYERILNGYPSPQCRPKLADDMVFSDPKKVAALQAADLVTYWMGQFMIHRAQTGSGRVDTFPHAYELRQTLRHIRSYDDLKLMDFQGLMAVLTGVNRYIKTSIPTRDQSLPSLPVKRRQEVLGVMRKVNFRRFLDQWKPTAQ